MTSWIFLIAFPILFGTPSQPVISATAAFTEAQCNKVRSVFTSQMPRPTTIKVSECFQGVIQVIPDIPLKEEPPSNPPVQPDREREEA